MEAEDQRDASDLEPRTQRAVLATLVAILVGAALSRIAMAGSKSLVIDEFHSWYHATRPDLSTFFEGLRLDNHPPLSFLVIGVARAALGSAELALRSPALIAGLVEIALVARLARQLAGPRASILGALLLATSSLHFDYGTQARMYALLALAITVAVSALIELIGREQPARGARVALTLSAAAAFHTHYFGLQYLGVLAVGAAVAASACKTPERARRLLAPLLAAAALSLPWALTGFRAQLANELPPGGDDIGVLALVESFVHLFTHNLSFGGETGRFAFAAAGGLALILAGCGAVRLLHDESTRAAGILLASCAFAVPIVAWGLAHVLPRAGFTWHYVLPSAASAAVLAAAGARGRVGTAAVAVALVGTTALCALHLGRPATEDFRGAIAYALDAANAGGEDETVRIVSVEWQPALFPQGQPYDYYAPRLAATPPVREPMVEGGFTVVDPARLMEADRVIVIRRSLPDEQFLLTTLRTSFGAPEQAKFGYGVDVLIFAR